MLALCNESELASDSAPEALPDKSLAVICGEEGSERPGVEGPERAVASANSFLSASTSFSNL